MQPFSWVLMFISEAIRVCALLLPSPSHRHAAFVPIIIIHVYLALFTTFINTAIHQTLSCLIITQTLTASDFLLLTDAQSTLWRRGGLKFPELKTIWERLIWAIDLSYNTRGIGWNFEAVEANPPHPASSRLQFVAYQLRRAFISFLLFDAASTVFRENAVFRRNGSITEDVSFFWRAAYVLAVGTAAVSSLTIYHAVMAICFVSLGLTTPSYWPNLFGRWSDAYTVRRFWGRSYHQSLRRFLTSHGDYVRYNALHLKSGSRLSTYTGMYIAFLVSGFLHSVGSYVMLRRIQESASTILFFVLQAVAITTEDAVLALGRGAGVQRGTLTRTLGYVWVVIWLTLSVPIWVGPLLTAGLFAPDNAMPFSIIVGLWKGEWVSRA